MAVICPSVTSENTHQYREQIERVAPFAKRIHIDFMDGKFAPNKSPGLLQAWWPEKAKADLHIMYEHPEKDLEEMISLKPHLVVVHAESGGNFVVIARNLHEAGIKVGVALLPKTSVDIIKTALQHVDHVLIFSGDLGHFGGNVDFSLLEKVKACKQLKPDLEIGWDGGISDANIKKLHEAGVDVFNVGGYIQRAEKPRERYEILESLLH
jgi:ribulose-phosphate 3-epimerase